MKICVYGAGAIGGFLGIALADAGADVSLVARGPHLTAMGGALEGTTVETVDPDGAQCRLLTPERGIGRVVYPATEVIEPGVIKHVYGRKFPIGEPGGVRTPRIKRLHEALVTVVQELGRRTDVSTPTIDVVLALIQQRASVARQSRSQ